MKRVFSLLLVLCFLPALTVTAADNFGVSVSAPNEVFWGDTIDVTFSFDNVSAEGLCGMDFELGYDASMVELAGVSLSGFPTDGNWCSAGRTVNGVYYLHVFDNYDESAGAPVSVYTGTVATVTVAFKSKVGIEGDALFSIGTYGSVTGTVFTDEGPVFVYGLGAQSKTVTIKPVACTDKSGDGWFTKDGVMYVFPGVSAEELAAAGVLSDAEGTVKEGAEPAAKGDSFVFADNSLAPVYIAMDVNGDGYFNTTDYLYLRRCLCDGTVLSGSALIAADANCDGVPSVADLAVMESVLKNGVLPY